MTLYHFAILLHVLGATIWLGGHLILSLRVLPKALKYKDENLIRSFEQAFEPVGLPALLLQIITGLWIAFVQHDLNWFSFSTAQNTVVSLKLILLILTLILAIHARLFLIPRLNPENLNSMAFHIILITIIAVFMVYLGVQFRFGGIEI